MSEKQGIAQRVIAESTVRAKNDTNFQRRVAGMMELHAELSREARETIKVGRSMPYEETKLVTDGMELLAKRLGLDLNEPEAE